MPSSAVSGFAVSGSAVSGSALSGSAASDAQPGQPEINPDLQDVAHRVHEEFDERLDPLEVDECLNRVAAQFDDAKVRSFVPLLVRRYVHDELQGRLECA